jgi:uncharacterized integral membrane protein (TIGR00697 family)
MNIVLGIISIIATFSIVVCMEKMFKKEGLYVWISIATIMANILVCKSIDILGLTASLGNVMFASIFLATDILSEKYDVKDSRKAVMLAIVSQIIFILATTLAVSYIPSETDLSNESMKTLFSINARVSISSIVMFGASNMLDIYLFEKLKKKFPKQLWLRNNVSTIISNCLENYFFVFFAFVGIYDYSTILSIATTTSILEIIIAICDTPFMYIAKKLK